MGKDASGGTPFVYSNYIDQFLEAEEGAALLLAVWSEEQLIPARLCIERAEERWPHSNIECAVVTDREVTTGDLYWGPNISKSKIRRVVRYASYAHLPSPRR